MRVLASLSHWDKNTKIGFLRSENIDPPNIFIDDNILKGFQLETIDLQGKKLFYAEIEPAVFGNTRNWKILKLEIFEIPENYSSRLHKQNLRNIFLDKNQAEERLKHFETALQAFGKQIHFYKNIAERHIKIAELLTNQRIKVSRFIPSWRMIVGLGSGSVFETSITLHHIYGIPYIPATAIKGVLRSYLISRYFNNSETSAFQTDWMCDIFGCPEDIKDHSSQTKIKTYYKTEIEGKIIFFDAFPTKNPRESIRADIMNPHYADYYTNDKPPADTQSPVPIFFLTVENLEFQVIIGLAKQAENKHFNLPSGPKFSGPLLDLTSNLLTEALQSHGVGSKTSVGYGYMKKVE